MNEGEILKEQAVKLFEVLYAKGRLEYDVNFRTNETFFRLRENPIAYLLSVVIIIDVDKYFPSSKDYDPTYVKLIGKLHNVDETIPRYLGEPNLVFNVEYTWDEEQMKKVYEQFKDITYEVAENYFNANKDKLVRSYTESPEQFLEYYEFAVYISLSELDAEVEIEVYSHEVFCRMWPTWGLIETYVEPVLEKYGYGDYNIESNMCEGQG